MFTLRVTLDSPIPFLTAALLYISVYFDFRESPPDGFVVDGESEDFADNWLEDYAKTCDKGVLLYWGNGYYKRFNYLKNAPLIFWTDKFTNFGSEDISHFPKQLLEYLKYYPWTIATFGPAIEAWYGWDDYESYIFDYSYAALGWGCAFKGDGHKRVVSRRYLEYGPWHVLRDEENDVTLIQFHDMSADALTALEQARVGHQYMGNPPAGPFEGGFIMNNCAVIDDPNVIHQFLEHYDPKRKLLCQVMDDIAIDAGRMMGTCIIRHGQLLGDDYPIERVGYIFSDESEARKYLHELWLREIECWVIMDGEQVRIDIDYTPPPPEKPEWVQRLEAKDKTPTT